jgi:hypothetical protein
MTSPHCVQQTVPSSVSMAGGALNHNCVLVKPTQLVLFGPAQKHPSLNAVAGMLAAAHAWRQAPLQRLLEGPHSGQQYSPARVTAGQVRLRLPAAGGGPTPGKPCCIPPLGSRFWNPTEEAMRWLRQKVMLMYCGVLAAGSAETRVCCALFTVMGLSRHHQQQVRDTARGARRVQCTSTKYFSTTLSFDLCIS